MYNILNSYKVNIAHAFYTYTWVQILCNSFIKIYKLKKVATGQGDTIRLPFSRKNLENTFIKKFYKI